MYAADLARSPDGQWWVLADRTQAPSGAGYALENRLVTTRVLPDVFRASHIRRLANFFQTYREALQRLVPGQSRKSAHRAPDARPLQRNVFRARVPGPLSRLHAGRRRRSHGARQSRLLENTGRPASGGRHRAPPGRPVLRPAGIARRFHAGRARAGASRALRQRGHRQRAWIGPGGVSRLRRVPSRTQPSSIKRGIEDSHRRHLVVRPGRAARNTCSII